MPSVTCGTVKKFHSGFVFAYFKRNFSVYTVQLKNMVACHGLSGSEFVFKTNST